ncbi:MAG TPA: hypothetical protein VFQ50_09200 [Flavobacterium sp.]|jgi:hypothetical protein|nr:hypothetical protein [Flavobacterium sp.]
MDILKVLIASFSATNIMTTFSYLLSVTYGKLFKEPVLLNFILDGVGVSLKGRWKKAGGWFAHYIIGVLFVFAYEAIWLYTGVVFSWGSGLIFGAVSGFVGIIGWQTIYLLPRQKPDVPLHDYYLQLFSHTSFLHVRSSLLSKFMNMIQ